jgi:hypothetical protein
MEVFIEEISNITKPTDTASYHPPSSFIRGIGSTIFQMVKLGKFTVQFHFMKVNLYRE